MPKISFFLKKDAQSKGKDNTYPIFVRFTHRGAREFMQTYLRARVSDIVAKDGRMRARPQVRDALNLNIMLDNLQGIAVKTANEFKVMPQGSFAASDMKAAFEKAVRPGNKSPQYEWLQVFDDWIRTAPVSPVTKKGYVSSKNKFAEFLGGKKPKIGEISPDLLNRAVDWALDVKKHDPVYVDNFVTDIRSCLKWFNKRTKGIVNLESLIYRPERKLTKSPKPAIFLTKDEFAQLVGYVPAKAYLERAKDLFLFLCYTGLRVSDLYIEQSEIQDGIILKSMDKTDRYARIPILDETKAILEKYNYMLPVMSDVNLNKFIKELLREAGIDGPVKIVTYPGGVKKETVVPKWKAISTKVGRKTLVSKMIAANIHEKKIRTITGHAKPLNLEPYMGVEDRDIDDALKKAFEYAHFL